MSRGRKKLRTVANPLIVIQWIIATTTIAAGAYVASPFLRLSVIFHGKSALLQTIGSDVGIIVFGFFFILSGLLMVAGIVKRKVEWRSAGLFLNGLCRLYVIIAGFLAFGFLPLNWLSNAVIMFIVFYIWARIRKRGVE